MTLVVGLRGKNGVVLASDSQATHGILRKPTPKLFRTRRIVWGTAGPLAGAQDLYSNLEQLDLDPKLPREKTKAAIVETMKTCGSRIVTSGEGSREWFEGLFGWFDELAGRHHLLLARGNGHSEFMTPYGAVGSSKELGTFGFTRSAFIDFRSVQLEATKMLAFAVAEDAINASARGVDRPIQLAVASHGEAVILDQDELRPVEEAVAGFQLYQRDFFERVDGEDNPAPSGGIVPGD